MESELVERRFCLDEKDKRVLWLRDENADVLDKSIRHAMDDNPTILICRRVIVYIFGNTLFL